MALGSNPHNAEELILARRARMVAIVIAVTMLLWMAAQWAGARYGWAPRFAFLFDLAALAGFIWAMTVTYQIWRRRRDMRQDTEE